MMNRYLFLIMIAIITLTSGAPIEAQTSVTSTNNNNNTLDKWWNNFLDHALHPTLKFLTESTKPDETQTFKSGGASINFNNISNDTTFETTTQQAKIFGYLDDALWEMMKLTNMGYIYMTILVVFIILILCITCCCCCCCGCCRR